MLKESMVAAKSSLTVTKLELKALASSSQEYEDMLSVLGQVLAVADYASGGPS